MKRKSGSHSGKQARSKKRSKKASGPTSPQLSETPVGPFDCLGLDSSVNQEEFALRMERKGPLGKRARNKKASEPMSF
jgi:hypothetical protein